MASYSPKLLEKKYHNWVKAGLAVLFTKEGIEPFVYDELQKFQLECLDDICYNNGLMSGTTCSNCCTENVVACPTRGICNINRGQCKYHKDFTTQYNPSGCPSKLCNNFKNRIQSVHRFNGPSYRNTDATQWCSNPWEMAKCFMPPDGYKDVMCATETDFNGINSVIINHKGFQSKIHDDLSNKSNIFEKARVICQAVRHSPSLQVHDISLTHYFTELQHLLLDSGHLNTNTHAQNAKQKLSQTPGLNSACQEEKTHTYNVLNFQRRWQEQRWKRKSSEISSPNKILQNDTLVIGKEEVRKVLDDVAKAVQDKIRTEIDEQKKEAKKRNHELLKASHTALDSLKKKEEVSVAELNNALSSALHQIEEKTENSLKRLENKTDDLMKTLESKTDEYVEKINIKTEDSVKTLETNKVDSLDRIHAKTDKSVKMLEAKSEDGVEKINIKTEDSVKTLETNKVDSLDKIHEKTDKSVKMLEDKSEEGVEKINIKTEDSVKTLETNKVDSLDRIHDKTDKSVTMLEAKSEEGVEKINIKTEDSVKTLETKKVDSLDRIHDKTDKSVKMHEAKSDEGVEKINIKTEDSVKTLETNKVDSLDRIHDKTDKSVKMLEAKSEEGVEKINIKTEDSVKTLETNKVDSLDRIHDKTDKSVKMLEAKSEEGVEKINIKTEDSVKTLETNKVDSLDRIHDKTDKSVKMLEAKSEEGVEKISQKTDNSAKKLDAKTSEGFEKINDKTADSVQSLETKIVYGVEIIDGKTDDSVKTLETKTEEGVEKIKQNVSTADRHREEDLYNSLRDDLIQHYREQYSSLPITPLLDGIIDVPLLEMYVPPFPMASVETDNMKLINMQPREESTTKIFRGKRKKVDETKEVKCNALSDVFSKNKISCKNIYITAEPGFGKSSFVKWLVLIWCQARKRLTDFKEFVSEADLQQVREFEFVFLVLLQDTQPEETHVDKILANHLISVLARQSQYSMADVETVLSTRKCLIILDGLDEWNSSNDPTMLPNRAARDTCSYITTSRPWKMATVSVKSSQIDQHVQVKDLQRICTDRILPKILNIFRKNNSLRSGDCLDVTETDMRFGLTKGCSRKLSTEELRFLQMLKKKKIEDFAASPVMLTQILYLWNSDNTVGNSQCQIYSNIVDALLARAIEKGTVPSLSKYKNYLTCTLSYFDKEAYNCYTYYKLLLEIGNVAFQTLFSGQKESSLVFQKKDLKQNVYTGNNDELVDTVVKVGLLSQEMHMTARRKEYSYSFYHKTIQEYFAALYIQFNPDDHHVIEKITTRCNTVSSVLEMETVFMFLSGFNPEIACDVLQNLQSTINDDPKMEECRSESLYFRDNSLTTNVQRMIISCVQECRSNGHELLVSDTSKNAIQFPLCDIVIDEDFHTEFYCIDMEYIIKCNGSRIKSLFIENYDDREGTGLTESLTYSNVDCLEYLDVTYCKELPPLLSSLYRLVHLKSISLAMIDLGERLVLGPGMKHIESVDLTSIELTNTAFHMLVDTLLAYEHSVTVDLFEVTVNDRTVVKQEETVKHDISTLPTVRGERSDHGRKMFHCLDVNITTRTLQEFVYTVEKFQHPVTVRLMEIIPLKPDTEHASKNDDERLHTNDQEGYQKVKEYIRSSSLFTVQKDLQGYFHFMANYEPENSDKDTSDESDY